MGVRKVVRKRIRHEGEGVQAAADVNVAVVANVNEPGSQASVRSRQRIVQRTGRARASKREGGERDG